MTVSKTLLAPFTLKGIGIHTGAAVQVEVCPSSTPRGRIFFRNGVDIPATVEFVTDTRRCTTLGRDHVTVSTVEHLLAALLLAGVDHAEIHVDGPELPAFDGSAYQWFTAICAAGICEMGVENDIIRIPEPRMVIEEDSLFFLLPSDEFIAYSALSIPDTIADRMIAGGPVTQAETCEQIVRARTFGLEREVQALLAAGLARGGSLDNAVVLTQTGYLNAHVWPNEPAWHKVLDLLGDLALTGTRFAGQILAVRSGHRSNVALVRQLRHGCVTHQCGCL